MLNFLKEINNNYAALLACVISLISAVTTVVYVVFTHKQMKAAQDSVQLMQTEMKQNKQPCLIPIISRVYSDKALSNGRRFMPIDFCVENVGDAPALSVYAISHLELKHIKTKDESRIVNMFSGPYSIHCVKVGEKQDVRLHYEEDEISIMFQDLAINMQKNRDRIRNCPSKNAYRGTDLVLQIYYKNLSGQWFSTTLRREICWAMDDVTKEKNKHNLNEYTFPPRMITDDTTFELVLSWLYNPQIKTEMINEEDVFQTLECYRCRYPGAFND